MGRPKRWPPAVHRHSSGQDYVRIDGRNVYLGASGSEAAKAKYAAVVARVAAGLTPTEAKAPEQADVRRVVAAWWAAEGERLSDRGREKENYGYSLRPLLKLYADIPAARFGAAELEALQLAMASGSWAEPGTKAAEGWCAGVVNQRISRIKTVWRWAERKSLVPVGAWGNLRTVPGLKRNDRRVRHAPRRRAATWDEIEAVAEYAVPPVRAVLLLQWHSGMRPAEAYSLTPEEIDRTGDVWVYRPGKHKTDYLGHGRNVVLNEDAQAVLSPWLAGADPSAVLFRPMPNYSSPRAEVYNDTSFAHAVGRAAKKADLKGVTSYMVRHSVKMRVTRLSGLDAARAILGQRSIQTTDGYGDATDLETAKDAARKLR